MSSHRHRVTINVDDSLLILAVHLLATIAKIMRPGECAPLWLILVAEAPVHGEFVNLLNKWSGVGYLVSSQVDIVLPLCVPRTQIRQYW